MKPELHERKWELDSLCYVIRLSYDYWLNSKDNSCLNKEWLTAMRTIVMKFKAEQRKNGKSTYSFHRKMKSAFDTAQGDGYGNPASPNGLICSVFRPSDNSTIFPYLIPSNYFALKSLEHYLKF